MPSLSSNLKNQNARRWCALLWAYRCHSFWGNRRWRCRWRSCWPRPPEGLTNGRPRALLMSWTLKCQKLDYFESFRHLCLFINLVNFSFQNIEVIILLEWAIYIDKKSKVNQMTSSTNCQSWPLQLFIFLHNFAPLNLKAAIVYESFALINRSVRQAGLQYFVHGYVYQHQSGLHTPWPNYQTNLEYSHSWKFSNVGYFFNGMYKVNRWPFGPTLICIFLIKRSLLLQRKPNYLLPVLDFKCNL